MIYTTISMIILLCACFIGNVYGFGGKIQFRDKLCIAPISVAKASKIHATSCDDSKAGVFEQSLAWHEYPNRIYIASKHYCLDSWGNGQGSEVAVEPCHARSADKFENQEWIVVDGLIKLKGTNLCLDVEYGIIREGKKILLWDCLVNKVTQSVKTPLPNECTLPSVCIKSNGECKAGTTVLRCTECQSDKYYLLNSECTTCPDGTKCNGISTQPCGTNKLCKDGVETVCGTNKLCKDGVETVCGTNKLCKDGVETVCPANSICENGSVSKCEDGYYLPPANDACKICPEGSDCSLGVKNPCTPGHFCPTGTSSINPSKACTKQKDCNRSLTECMSNIITNVESLQCDVCNRGYYLDIGKCTLNTDATKFCNGKICSDCNQKQTECNIPSTECVDTKNNLLKCTVNGCQGAYLTDSTGLCVDRDDCVATVCQNGKQCINEQGGFSCNKCDSNKYCDGSGLAVVCPSHAICSGGIKQDCKKQNLCTENFLPLTCISTLVPELKCSKCHSGYFPDLVDGKCHICPEGSDCTTGVKVTCGSGMYCPAGTGSGGITPQLCPPGFQCPNGVKDGTACVNKYCPGGAALAQSCPLSTKQPNCQKTSSTDECVAGKIKYVQKCDKCYQNNQLNRDGECIANTNPKQYCDGSDLPCQNCTSQLDCVDNEIVSSTKNCLPTINTHVETLQCNQCKIGFYVATNGLCTPCFDDYCDGFVKQNCPDNHVCIQGRKGNCSLDAFQLVNQILKRKKGADYDYVTKCKKLDLSFNNIKALDPDVFVGLFDLTYLDISDNKLTTLPPGIYDDTVNLVYLNLENNMFDNFPPGIFDGLSELQSLALDEKAKCTSYGFKITKDGDLSPKKGNELDNCKSINLVNNSINSMDDASFQKFKKLKTILLAGNTITLHKRRGKRSNKQSDHQTLSNLFYQNGKNIQTLDVSSNKLTSKLLLDSFGKFENLKHLNLSYNSINDLSFLKKGLELTTLDLSSNPIKNLVENTLSAALSNSSILNISNTDISCCASEDELTKLLQLKIYVPCQTNGNKSKLFLNDEIGMIDVTIYCNQLQQMVNGGEEMKSNMWIIGLVVGLCVLIVIVAVVFAYVIYKRKQEKDDLLGMSAKQFVLDSEYDPNEKADYNEYNNFEELQSNYSSIDPLTEDGKKSGCEYNQIDEDGYNGTYDHTYYDLVLTSSDVSIATNIQETNRRIVSEKLPDDHREYTNVKYANGVPESLLHGEQYASKTLRDGEYAVVDEKLDDEYAVVEENNGVPEYAVVEENNGAPESPVDYSNL